MLSVYMYVYINVFMYVPLKNINVQYSANFRAHSPCKSTSSIENSVDLNAQFAVRASIKRTLLLLQ